MRQRPSSRVGPIAFGPILLNRLNWTCRRLPPRSTRFAGLDRQPRQERRSCLEYDNIFGGPYAECQQLFHARLCDSLLVQILTTVKRCGSDLNDSVSTASATCEHLQLDQPYRHPDRTHRIWLSNDHHKYSNEHNYRDLHDQSHAGEGERNGSTRILPLFCRNPSRQPNSVSNRVGSYIWKHVMDSHDRSTDPERDPSLRNSYSLQRLCDVSYRYISHRLHWIRGSAISA